MSNSFRIDESELRGWHAALAPRMDVRGIPAIAKEIEAHLLKRDADGSVVVSRHQLFTWAEALQGASMRAGGGELAQVVGEMRAILGGKPAAPPAAATFTPPSVMDVAPSMFTGAPPPSGYQAAPAAYAPAPPVQYGAPAGASSGGAARVVAGAELGELARDLVRRARNELLVSSPWETGVETLVQEIVALPPAVQVRIVSRRPAQESSAYHQTMDQLGRRRAVTAFSPYIQTRLIVQDEERALVGAASVPGAASREAAVLLTDRAVVAQVRAHFERVHAEAAGTRA